MLSENFLDADCATLSDLEQGASFRAMKRILISTTVPETLATILKRQPHFLAQHFQVALATSPGEAFSQVADNEGLAIYAVPMTRGISILNDLASVVRMARVLRQLEPDVVHSYTPKAGLVTMLAAWLCRVPVRVHTFTGLIFPTSTGFRKKLLIWIDRLICACATHVVPEGQGVKQDLERFRITHKPLRVIGHGNIAGVDTEYFSPVACGVEEMATELRNRLAIEKGAFLFAFVGRLNKDKGLAELMHAFNSLPINAHLVVVGGLDQAAPVDASTLAAIALHPRVHSLGFLKDIRAVLCMSDILVLPSYREGFPNVILQAGAMTLPVVATDINGSNEIIQPGNNGWLVPPRDPKALGNAMRHAMDVSADFRGEMGLLARVRVQRCFEQKEHWERMVEFYQGLLPNHQKVT
jgi:glycosyltransferase involved in cell wall biosynthesis